MKAFKPLDQEDYIKSQEDRHVRNDYEYDVSFWNRSILDNYPEYLASPILDVGCRNGLFLDVLSELGYEAKGIELTAMADWAIKQGRDVIRGDIQDPTPYPDKYFKTVIMSHVLEHLFRPADALQEVKRILDGYLIVHLPIMSPNEEKLKRYGEYLSFRDKEDVCELLTDNGLEIVLVGENSPLNQLIIAKTK